MRCAVLTTAKTHRGSASLTKCQSSSWLNHFSFSLYYFCSVPVQFVLLSQAMVNSPSDSNHCWRWPIEGDRAAFFLQGSPAHQILTPTWSSTTTEFKQTRSHIFLHSSAPVKRFSCFPSNRAYLIPEQVISDGWSITQLSQGVTGNAEKKKEFCRSIL